MKFKYILISILMGISTRSIAQQGPSIRLQGELAPFGIPVRSETEPRAVVESDATIMFGELKSPAVTASRGALFVSSTDSMPVLNGYEFLDFGQTLDGESIYETMDATWTLWFNTAANKWWVSAVTNSPSAGWESDTLIGEYSALTAEGELTISYLDRGIAISYAEALRASYDAYQLGLNKVDLSGANTEDNFLHSSFSAGRLWGGEITANGTLGKIDIAAGAGIIKDGAGSWDNIPADETDGQAGQLGFVSWDAVTGLDLAGVGYNLIYWDASVTNFTASLDTTFYADFDFVTDFTIGRMYYDGTESTIRLCGMNMWNFPRRAQMFGEERFPVERANGLLGSAVGLQYAVTDGVIWAEMVNRFEVDGKTLAEDFRYWFTTNATYDAWTYSTTNVIDAANFNGVAGLTGMANNRWRCDYVYAVHDSSHHVVLGNAQFTSAANAQAAAVRIPPGLLSAYATLVGRITVQQGAATMTFDNATPDSAFAAYAVPDHNGLAGLQGGAADEYYHLTAADYVNATNITAALAGKVDLNGSNSVFNVANFIDNYNGTNWTAVLSWDASNKVFTVSETGVAE